MTRLRPVAVLHSLSLQRLHPDPFSSDGTLQMTQQQLARNLGTTREGVARLIGEFVNALRTRRGALAPRSVWVAARGIAGPACEGLTPRGLHTREDAVLERPAHSAFDCSVGGIHHGSQHSGISCL